MIDVERTATERVTREIVRFLESSKPEVLALRGAWGVGKTYLWNKLLKETKATIRLRKYAYVSLFGLQNLNELKYSIYENTIDTKDVGIEPSLKTLQTNTDFVVKSFGTQLISVISRFKGASATLEAISFLAVRDRIVCIDDLERRGSNLRIIDVLGLVSYLTERRGCKIVIILNDQALTDPDTKDLARYQEKVIDLSLLFAPTEEESVKIALAIDAPTTLLLSERCISLGVSNIRVIKKIERLFADLLPLLSGYHEKVAEQAASTLTLFGWAHFSKTAEDDNAFIDFILARSDDPFAGVYDDADEQPERHKWDTLLDNYGYASTDAFDLALFDGVKRGFFDEAQIKRNADEMNERLKQMDSTKSFADAWALFHDSFKDNAREIVRALVTAMQFHAQFVTPSELNGAVSLLKTLGRERAAQYVLKLFMKRRQDEDYAFYDLASHPFTQNIQDPDVIYAFAEKLKTFRDERSPEDILHSIGSNHGWSQADTKLLAVLSVDDYYAMFKNLEGERLRRVISAALGFQAIREQDATYGAIADTAKAALILIGKESPLNARRLLKFHITADDLA
ncbi:P-loop NTPase fold protein [Bradyrhizobium sp. SZCCHNPS1003]|uniref:P-loop NTPase fold protein n=1 Tax=Bradyrhizobium sp. SZCCHNPS1003 TaxID=3057330 RepID=UPI0028E2E5DE|nr:P-loop NTPase fold protein [Bradyrhizobium sp. SZCCHNPS1003]